MASDYINTSLGSLREKSQLYNSMLNSVSREIKQVEAELQELNICVKASAFLGRDNLNQTEKSRYFQKNINEWQILETFAEENLSWQKDILSGKYRIFYSREIKEDRFGPEGFSTNTFACAEFPDGVAESKPLIECPIEIRVKAIPDLGKLVIEIEKNMDQFVNEMMDITGANLL